MRKFNFFKFLKFFLTKIWVGFIFVPNWQLDGWLGLFGLGYRNATHFRAE